MSAYAVPIYLPRRRRIITPGEWLREKLREQQAERERTIALAIGTPTSIGSNTYNTSASTVVLNVNTTVSAGQFVVVTAGGTNWSTVTSFTLSDSQGNIWATDLSVFTTVGIAIGSAQIANALTNTDTITGTFGSASPAGRLICGIQVSGMAASAAADQSASASGTATGWSSGGSATTTQNEELVIGCCASDSTAAETNTPGGSYSELFDLTNGSATQLTAQYLIVAATGAQTATGTWTNSGSRNWTAGVMTYKGAAAGATSLETLGLPQLYFAKHIGPF